MKSGFLIAAFSLAVAQGFLEGDAPQEPQQLAPMTAADLPAQPATNPNPAPAQTQALSGIPDGKDVRMAMDNLRKMVQDQNEELGKMHQVEGQVTALPDVDVATANDAQLQKVAQDAKSVVTKIQGEVRKAGNDELKSQSDAHNALEELTSAIAATTDQQNELGESYMMGKSQAAQPAKAQNPAQAAAPKPAQAAHKDYSEALRHYERVDRALAHDSKGGVDTALRDMESATETILALGTKREGVRMPSRLGESDQTTPQEQIQHLKQELAQQAHQQQEQIQHLQQELSQAQQAPAAAAPQQNQLLEIEKEEKREQQAHVINPAQAAQPESAVVSMIREETDGVSRLMTMEKAERQDSENMVAHDEKMVRDLREGIKAARGA